MPEPMPTEIRWRCQACGADVEPDTCERFSVAPSWSGDFDGFSPLGFATPKAPLGIEDLDENSFALLSGPAERGHRIWRNVGSGISGHFGSRLESESCGPVRRIEIDVQELYVEWALGKTKLAKSAGK